jgi:hypothetical protein
VLRYPHHHRLGGDQLHLEGLEVRASPAEQAAVGHRGPGVVVVAREQRDQVVVGAHEVTATSHVASWLGVSAAISMPRSASRWAIALS